MPGVAAAALVFDRSRRAAVHGDRDRAAGAGWWFAAKGAHKSE
jgi:hypothetical protein